nr:G-type lectin S-receptor-like serine/threonine-protein kinase At4g27290 isoform X2 [Tanacetum cinerariifolium]
MQPSLKIHKSPYALKVEATTSGKDVVPQYAVVAYWMHAAFNMNNSQATHHAFYLHILLQLIDKHHLLGTQQWMQPSLKIHKSPYALKVEATTSGKDVVPQYAVVAYWMHAAFNKQQPSDSSLSIIDLFQQDLMTPSIRQVRNQVINKTWIPLKRLNIKKIRSLKEIILMEEATILVLLLFSLHIQQIYTAEIDIISESSFLTEKDTLVSSARTFELGFFKPGNSENTYVGIWYKKIPVQTVVWVANRDYPLTNVSSSMVRIVSMGNLVLMNNTDNVVWSSNTTSSRNATAQLLDTGNLVITDGKHMNIIWQSFDYPTDTNLPGMKLGKEGSAEWHLSSWKSSEDPATGEYTWSADTRGYPQFLLRDGLGAVKFRHGPWNGQRFSGSSWSPDNPIFRVDVVINESGLVYSYNLVNSSVISKSTLNSSGLLERSVWLEDEKRWEVIVAVPKDVCDTYKICGAYGSCNIANAQRCACLDEAKFEPKNKRGWETGNWAGGCVRRILLDCKNGTDGFINCMAYANTDIRGDGSGCLLWFNELLDIKASSNGDQNIFVRMAYSELGESGRQAMDDLPLFSFARVAEATSTFSSNNKLGEGGFGPVYKGMLEDGKEIAVKRLSKTSSQGIDEFMNEVVCISKLQHRNLVKLLGCSIDGDEKLLIYEYMPNRSLDEFLFDKTRSTLVDWSMRLNIIKGIARGLLYLHQDSRLRIIHRDLKASNILLDLDMNPKISDFGIARSFGGNETQASTERVVGTYGYMSPEYALDGLFSIKSDVFSYGVLVLEIVTGKRNRGFVHSEHNNNLIGHAWRMHSEGNSMELVDSSFAESSNPSEVLRSIEVGLLCVQQCPEDRPNMSSVVLMLGNEGALPKPKQPAFFTEKNLLRTDFSSVSSYPTSSSNDLTVTEIVAR